MDLMRGLLVGAALLAVLAGPLAAQQVSEARVREAIDDAARGLGQAVAGGSPLTAPAATTGGLGHFQVGVSAAVTRVEIEDARRPTGTLDFFQPVGTINAALGIARGRSAGLGAIDLVGRIGPLVAREDYRDSRMLYALGVRIGLLREGVLAPSISATIMRAWVENLEYGDPERDEISFEGDVRALSARLEASKGLALVTPYAGIGYDRAEIEAAYRIPASRSTGGRDITGRTETSGTHHKAYAGIDFALALAIATIEAGIHDGGGFGAFALRVGL